MQDVRIYVCCHKDYKDVGITDPRYRLISSNNIKNDTCLKLVRYDEELDNRLWSELSHMYHVWKHPELQADWIGFCHYRRYFTFMNDIPEFDKPMVSVPLRGIFNNFMQYFVCHNAHDLIKLVTLCKKEYPDYYPAFQTMCDTHIYHPFNMFIFPKALFNELCEFMFGLLMQFGDKIGVGNSYEKMLMHLGDFREEYVEKGNSPNNTYQYQARLYGFLAERIITAFIINYVKKNGKDAVMFGRIKVTENTYNKIGESVLEAPVSGNSAINKI